ncbi:Alpha-tubulin N-acetyltransferase [Schistosoma japonicum]|nr:Alpha-tubulin N-acetyltransferase [Schistosoma japonicum]
MDFGAGLENVLQQEVTVIHGEETRKLCIANNKYLNGKDADTFRNLAVLLDHLGERSARAQKLPKPVTSFIKFRNSDQSIFLLSDIPVKKFVILIYMFFRVIGFLKVGRKRLFVHDSKGVCVECIPLCILDFYIHESHQRKGYGKKLFDFMLKTENVNPQEKASVNDLNNTQKLVTNRSKVVTNSNGSMTSNSEVFNYRSSELQNRSRTSYSYMNAVRNHNCHTRLW